MKKINKIALLLILIASVFCFTSCKIYKFNIIEDEINIYVGEDKYLNCDYDIFTLEDVTKDSSEIEWTISDESVCRMGGNFVVGLSEGTAIVTGNYHGVIDSVTVNVTYEQVKSLELRPYINMFYFYYSDNEYKNQLVCVGDLFTVDADIVLTFEHKVPKQYN